MDEHDILTRCLRALAADFTPAHRLLDDVAVLRCDQALAISTDTVVEGVHFPAGALSAEQIARRALRVNLSDLAASAATPLCYLLGLQLPPLTDLDWMAGFAGGLREDQEHFGIRLAGGDTVRTPGPLAVSITVMGRVARDGTLPRTDTADGDVLAVTGTIGDAWLGRLELEGKLPIAAGAPTLAERFLLPAPRLEISQGLAALAHAAIDVSDGLIADVRNLCGAAGKGARISLNDAPLSEAARFHVDRGNATLEDLAAGGDDYELLFSIPRRAVPQATEIAAACGVALTVIGEVTDGPGVSAFTTDGESPGSATGGYVHSWNGPAD